MDSAEATAVMAEDIPLPRRGAETSVVAGHFRRPPAALTAAFAPAGRITAVAVTMAAAVITAAGDTMAQGSDSASVSMHLTGMLLACAIPEGSMTSTAFGGSIPVAQFPMAIKPRLQVVAARLSAGRAALTSLLLLSNDRTPARISSEEELRFTCAHTA